MITTREIRHVTKDMRFYDCNHMPITADDKRIVYKMIGNRAYTFAPINGVSKDIQADVMRAIDDGTDEDSIMLMYMVDKDEIKQLKDKNGIALRIKESSPERNRKIFEERKSGLTYKEIGELHGLTKQAIYQILKKYPV